MSHVNPRPLVFAGESTANQEGRRPSRNRGHNEVGRVLTLGHSLEGASHGEPEGKQGRAEK